ncbi:hypothetical protein HXA31_05900 [Salipaludibacillus agaradhaerens]|uniref:Uncharacterized protein n=1 Tax=Salipaludibacillus agaradhaerens TaxID=76935 RepID=A0A9Q4B1N3_SALAG|nr:hypothetical protein [Salipaludibacillus agaradhaerens]MCR6096551.1 hypothetical protein [Salipaludibacillus agaradhaerens]MCR6113890.1 hypothetical protein [Salipaludibacillus agaradhaerens]
MSDSGKAPFEPIMTTVFIVIVLAMIFDLGKEVNDPEIDDLLIVETLEN